MPVLLPAKHPSFSAAPRGCLCPWTAVLVIDDTYLFLRVDGNVMEGFDGCNSLWGRREDGTPIAKADGTFSGRQFGGTDIGCPDPVEVQAERYQNALVDGDRFRATRGQLEILDRAGNVRLVFTKQEELPGMPRNFREPSGGSFTTAMSSSTTASSSWPSWRTAWAREPHPAGISSPCTGPRKRGSTSTRGA